MRTLFAVIFLAVVVPPAALAGQSPTSTDRTNAAQVCRAQRAQIGAATFKATYGTNADRSNAFGKCVERQMHAQAAIRQEALRQCKAEQDDATFAVSHGGKTFEQYYGGGKKGALPNCVDAKSQDATAQQSQQTVNAAKQCRAQRDAMGSRDFGLLYGTGHKRANAFGRCVSGLQKSLQADGDNASQACRAEQADPTFAVSHGKTFADYYGTNADDSNAFGNCVSTKAKAAADARQTATLNGAETCKGERAANPAAFRAKYGGGSDAFGRCVSQAAKA